MPATFFVSTALIGSDRLFWWHRLEALLLREGAFPSRFELQDSRFGRSLGDGVARAAADSLRLARHAHAHESVPSARKTGWSNWSGGRGRDHYRGNGTA